MAFRYSFSFRVLNVRDLCEAAGSHGAFEPRSRWEDFDARRPKVAHHCFLHVQPFGLRPSVRAWQRRARIISRRPGLCLIGLSRKPLCPKPPSRTAPGNRGCHDGRNRMGASRHSGLTPTMERIESKRERPAGMGAGRDARRLEAETRRAHLLNLPSHVHTRDGRSSRARFLRIS